MLLLVIKYLKTKDSTVALTGHRKIPMHVCGYQCLFWQVWRCMRSVMSGVTGKDSYWSAACSAAGSAVYGRSWPPAGGSATVYDAAAPWSMSFPGSAPAMSGSASHCGTERPGMHHIPFTANMWATNCNSIHNLFCTHSKYVLCFIRSFKVKTRNKKILY